MPFFLIASGLVLNTNKYKIGVFTSKRAKTLLLPAFIFQFIVLPGKLYDNWTGSLLDTISSVGIVQSLTFFSGYPIDYVVPVWFFITLFQAHVLLRMINISERTTFAQMLLAILCCVVGYILYHFNFYYFGVGKLCMAIFFIIIGMLLKKVIVGEWFLKSKATTVVSLATLFIVWFFPMMLNGNEISLGGMSYGKNFLLYLVESVSGALLFMLLCQLLIVRLDKRSFFARLNEYAIFIISSHFFITVVIRKIWEYLGLSAPVAIVVSFVMTIILALLYIPIGNFVNKYLPILNGKCK